MTKVKYLVMNEINEIYFSCLLIFVTMIILIF